MSFWIGDREEIYATLKWRDESDVLVCSLLRLTGLTLHISRGTNEARSRVSLQSVVPHVVRWLPWRELRREAVARVNRYLQKLRFAAPDMFRHDERQS